MFLTVGEKKYFETNDISEGWDGTLNGKELPIGVYVYYVLAIDEAGEQNELKGDVTLLR
ncbi:MAG: gliding motility-associated C-terminal domain-containing protein [Flavobacteriales bacterium]|nr:gliding motility-associated C-terminal domain-containing protein [Flavobacteriales bacterium]